jgi:hypothetical protein
VSAVGKQKILSGINELFNDLTPEDKKTIPYFRVWCLFEIFHAAIFMKAQQEERQYVSNSSDEFEVAPNETSLMSY